MIFGCQEAGTPDGFLKSHPDCVLLGCNAFFWEGTGDWNNSPLYFKKISLER